MLYNNCFICDTKDTLGVFSEQEIAPGFHPELTITEELEVIEDQGENKIYVLLAGDGSDYAPAVATLRTSNCQVLTANRSRALVLASPGDFLKVIWGKSSIIYRVGQGKVVASTPAEAHLWLGMPLPFSIVDRGGWKGVEGDEWKNVL